MADKKITQLNELTVAEANDPFAIVDLTVTETMKITLANIMGTPGPIGATTPSTGAFTSINIDTENGLSLPVDDSNLAVGPFAGNALTTGAADNIAIGKTAMLYNETGYSNTVVGKDAGRGASGQSYNSNTFIGRQAGYSNETGESNVMVGRQAGYSNTSADDNIFIGRYAAYYTETGINNVVIGKEAGFGSSGQSYSNNVFIGYQAGFQETGSNKLYIETSDSTSPLIYGEFDNDLVRINGDLNVTGAVTGSLVARITDTITAPGDWTLGGDATSEYYYDVDITAIGNVYPVVVCYDTSTFMEVEPSDIDRTQSNVLRVWMPVNSISLAVTILY